MTFQGFRELETTMTRLPINKRRIHGGNFSLEISENCTRISIDKFSRIINGNNFDKKANEYI